MKSITFGAICLFGDERFLTYDKAKDAWTLDEGELDAYFKKMRNAGATGIRLLPWAPRGWYGPSPFDLNLQFQPYMVLGNKYTLAAFNKFYFPIAKRVIQIAKKYGLQTWWCWGDNCQFSGPYRKWSPWVTNVQGVATCYDPKAVPFIKAWIQKCADEFKGLGVSWAWGNEMTPAGMEAVAQNAIFPMIKKLKLDPKQMTYGAIMKDVKYYPKPAGWKPTPTQKEWEYYPGNAGMLDQLKKITGTAFGDPFKLAIWKEVHGIGGKGYPKIPNRLDQAEKWWLRQKNNGIRVSFSNDGVKDGDSKCDVASDGARPSAARMGEIAKALAAFGNDVMIEQCPQGPDDACHVATLREIYKGLNGKYPVARYK